MDRDSMQSMMCKVAYLQARDKIEFDVPRYSWITGKTQTIWNMRRIFCINHQNIVIVKINSIQANIVA